MSDECKGSEYPETPDQWRWYDVEWCGRCSLPRYFTDCDADFITPPCCDEVIVPGQCVGIPLLSWSINESDRLDRLRWPRHPCDSSGTAASLDCDDNITCVYGDDKPLTYRIIILAKCPDVESSDYYPYSTDRMYWENGPYRWDRPTD